MGESLGQIVRNAKGEGKNVLVMALSAGIIKPEHEYSGEADRRALIEIIGDKDKFNPTEEEWKSGYQKEFMGQYQGDWQAMYVTIANDVGVKISRDKALEVYKRKLDEVMQEKDNSVVPRVKESLQWLQDKGIPFSLQSGQEYDIITDVYLRDEDKLHEFVDERLVAGRVIPSTPENVLETAYNLIGTDYDFVILVDGNAERIAKVDTMEWKQKLGVDVVKVGVADEWVDEGLDRVTDYQFENMEQFYDNLTGD